jgi:hypothetical protein
MPYTLEQLEEKYRQLPEAVKEAMYSVETSDAVLAIGKKYNLHIDQIGLLAEEAGLVMLGLTPSYQFIDSIQKKLGVNRATAENITLDVNTEIFLPIREFLRQSGGGLPSREEVLRDIENPPPTLEETAPVPIPKTEAPTDTIFEQKMAKVFKLPKEEVPPPNPKVIDPYLEPTN